MEKLSRDNGGAILLWIVAGALLIFTAARSVHLVTSTLPPEMMILGVAALFGLDVGLIAWLFWTTRTARGGAQRTIGMLMVVVCLIGITAAVIGDTLLVAGGEQYAGAVETVAVFVVPAIVISNVAAIVLAHLFDPRQSIRDAQRALSDELEWQLADHLRQNAAQVAAGAVPEAAAHRQAEMVAGFMAGYRPSTNNANAGKSPDVEMAVEGPTSAPKATKKRTT